VLAAWQGSASSGDGARFRYVELFAGIGGFRSALEPLGGRCVLAVEIDAGARAIYRDNFHEECVPDVVALDAADVPPHDVLTAGFPCQPYAQCNTGNAALTGSLKEGPGLRSELGSLAFEVVRVLRAARPPAFLLENVPNLRNFNGGSDLAALTDALRDAGYSVHTETLDARSFGVPQQRKRLYIAGFRSDLPAAAGAPAFRFPGPRPSVPAPLRSVLEPPQDVPGSCWISQEAWDALLDSDPKAANPSGRGGRLARLDGYARTLTSSYRTKGGWRKMSELVPADGYEVCWEGRAADGYPVARRSGPPRFFTQRECCRLQGFPDSFVINRPDRRCQDPERFYHFIGNAVVPVVVAAVGEALLQALGTGGAACEPGASHGTRSPDDLAGP